MNLGDDLKMRIGIPYIGRKNKMAAIQYGIKLWFGLGIERQLPKGFTLVENPKNYARTRESKTGREYFVEADEDGGIKLIRCGYWKRRDIGRMAKRGNKVRIGEQYIDTRDTREFKEIKS